MVRFSVYYRIKWCVPTLVVVIEHTNYSHTVWTNPPGTEIFYLYKKINNLCKKIKKGLQVLTRRVEKETALRNLECPKNKSITAKSKNLEQ